MESYRVGRAAGPPSSEPAAGEKVRPGGGLPYRRGGQAAVALALGPLPVLEGRPRPTCCSLHCGVCLEKADTKILVRENIVYSGF